jgi:hypothetical protein
VKLGSAGGPDAGHWPDGAFDAPPRRPWTQQVSWRRVALVALAAVVLGWATVSPGGIEARLTRVDSGLRSAVANITQNRALENASTMFDKWYAQQGSYPKESQSQLDEDPNASWGPGMDVQWCSARAVVLTSLTVSGTVSRLLLDGKARGDVTGRVACPVNLDDPSPWSS